MVSNNAPTTDLSYVDFLVQANFLNEKVAQANGQTNCINFCFIYFVQISKVETKSEIVATEANLWCLQNLETLTKHT